MSTRETSRLSLDVWTDLVSPYCYITESALECALARFEHRHCVEVRWHTYRLQMSGREWGWTDAFMHWSSISRQEARQSLAEIERLAAEVDLEIHFDISTPTDTYDANRLAHYATHLGRRRAAVFAMQRAMFADGKRVDDHKTLLEIASDVGLDGDGVRFVLETDVYGDQIIQDEHDGDALGLTGLPFLRFDNGTTLTGLRSAQTLHESLKRAWIDRAPTSGRP